MQKELLVEEAITLRKKTGYSALHCGNNFEKKQTITSLTFKSTAATLTSCYKYREDGLLILYTTVRIINMNISNSSLTALNYK